MQRNLKAYIKKHKKTREREIIHASAITVVASIFLAIFEVIVGLVSNSSAIVLYGIETVSTAMASVVIIYGIKLSAKEPDKKHPMGYGRLEYVADLVVATIIIYVGFTGLINEIKAIVNPQIPNYTLESYGVLVVAMVTKFYLAIHEREMSLKHRSRALAGAAVDSFASSLFSLSIILSAIIYVKFEKSIENFIGLFIALFIIRNGFDIFINTLTEILGKKAHFLLIEEIKKTIMGFNRVRGVYDFVLHSYGRDKFVGSVHIEVGSDIDILELEILQRRIIEKVYLEHGVELSAVGFYATELENKDFMEIYNYLQTFAKHYRDIHEVHGLFLDKEKKEISFDIVVECNVDNKELMINAFKTELEEEYEGYTVNIQRDMPL